MIALAEGLTDRFSLFDVSVMLAAAVLWMLLIVMANTAVNRDLAPGRGCIIAAAGTLAVALTVRSVAHVWAVSS